MAVGRTHVGLYIGERGTWIDYDHCTMCLLGYTVNVPREAGEPPGETGRFTGSQYLPSLKVFSVASVYCGIYIRRLLLHERTCLCHREVSLTKLIAYKYDPCGTSASYVYQSLN